MRLLIAAAVLVGLAGCSSVADVRGTPPLLVIKSSVPAEQVAECIRDGWQSTKVVGGSIGGVLQKSGPRYSVVASPEIPWHVADVDPDQSGSTVTYHFYRTWQSPPAQVQQVIRSCAG